MTEIDLVVKKLRSQKEITSLQINLCIEIQPKKNNMNKKVMVLIVFLYLL